MDAFGLSPISLLSSPSPPPPFGVEQIDLTNNHNDHHNDRIPQSISSWNRSTNKHQKRGTKRENSNNYDIQYRPIKRAKIDIDSDEANQATKQQKVKKRPNNNYRRPTPKQKAAQIIIDSCSDSDDIDNDNKNYNDNRHQIRLLQHIQQQIESFNVHKKEILSMDQITAILHGLDAINASIKDKKSEFLLLQKERDTTSETIVSTDDDKEQEIGGVDIDSTNDVIIPNHVFRADIFIHDDEKKFGEKGKGRIRHDVTMNVPILPNNDVIIRRNSKGEYYCNGIPMDDYVLSSDKWLTTEMELAMDSNIYGGSEWVKIPCEQRVKLNYNGVFCCCQSKYEKQQDYGKQKDRNCNKKKSKNRNNVSTNNRQKDKDGIKIIKHVIRDGKLDIVWTMHGIDIDCFVHNNNDGNATNDNKTKSNNNSNNNNKVDWIQCNGPCRTWQHTACIHSNYKNIDKQYLCSLLCAKSYDGSINLTSSLHRNIVCLKMIESIYSYKGGQSKRGIKYGGDKQSYNSWTVDELRKLTLKLGIYIDAENVSKSDLIDKVISAPIFTQTPPKLCKCIASIPLENGNDYIAEFGSGNGNIAKYLREANGDAIIDAFEIDKGRVVAAKAMYPNLNINWIQSDILGMKHLESKIDDEVNVKYDRIYMNAEYEKGFGFIYVALQMLKDDGCIIALLPDNFFNGSIDRIRLSRILPFKIVKRYPVGYWNYYPRFDKNMNIKLSNPKSTADSIWILEKFDTEKHDFVKRGDYPTSDMILNGDL